MHNLTLSEPELQRLLRVFGYVVVTVWAVCVGATALFTQDSIDLMKVAKTLPLAVTISGFVFALLYGASWKNDRLSSWLKRPAVHGAWCGTLISDYKVKRGVELHIPIVFVIRQTYLSLSVQSYTPGGQVGTSTLEALTQDSRTGETHLRYVFGLTRQYRNENKVTKGTGELRLESRASLLRGFYWTSTPTHGEIRLKRMTRDCEAIDNFEMALERWPDELAAAVKEVPVDRDAYTVHPA
jgi:hypothetical protein